MGVATRPSSRLAAAAGAVGGRPVRQLPAGARASGAPAQAASGGRIAAPELIEGDPGLAALIREWLLELKVMGRSPRTIGWYQQKLDWYLRTGEAQTLLPPFTRSVALRR